MKHITEERRALFAGGDLSWAEARLVEEHLQTCACCREAVAAFRDCSVTVQRSLGEPAVDELWAVRRRVLERLEESRFGGWRWTWAATVVFAVVALVVGIGWQRAREAAPHSSVMMAQLDVPYEPAARILMPNVTERVQQARVRRHRSVMPGVRAVTLLAQRDGPPMLKMVTNDPNVVILWRLQGRTEEQ